MSDAALARGACARAQPCRRLLVLRARRHRGAAAPVLLKVSDYVLNIFMQAVTYAIAVLGMVVVLGYTGQINLAQAAFFGFGAYAVGAGHGDLRAAVLGLARDRHGHRRRGRAGSRPDHAAAGRSLSGHDHHQLPEDLRSGGGQLGRADPRAGRHCGHRPPVVLRPCADRSARLPAVVLRWCCTADLVRLVAAATRGWAVRCAPCATTNWRPRPSACIRCARKSSPSPCARRWAASAAACMPAGFGYISPDNFNFARSVEFLTEVLLGGAQSPFGGALGHGADLCCPNGCKEFPEGCGS